jgi:SHS2 domain-containing protein
MNRFEVIEHTADVGIIAYGRSLEELFANAAAGMMHFLIDKAMVRKAERRTMTVEADDRESLLINWLSDLLVVLNADGFIPADFNIRELTDTRLTAEIAGEPVDPTRHAFRLDVKAATYHALEIGKNGYWYARIIFDV